MTQYKSTLVNIPDDKGVHTKSAGAKGEKYVYKYTKYYRNSDGDPRNKAKAIGKYDPVSGRMFPNGNYFEMFNLQPSLPSISVWDYGYTYVILKACHDMGLLSCLTQSFGAQAMEIIVMAAYINREGNAMDGIDDWQQRNYFPEYRRLLTSQTTSKIFGALTATKREDFFRLWVERALDDGSVCYDVTSISSYSQGMSTVERGYNRDGDDLAQYNLGMFCNELTKMPLYYNRYNGSLTDKTNLSYVLANARSVGIGYVKVILDGGFWSEECIRNLNSFCDTFTLGMPAYLKESEKIIAAYGDGIETYANELDTRLIYCIPVVAEVCGVPGRVMLYYDSSNHLNLCYELSCYIDRLKSELAALKRYPKGNLNRYTPYFVVNKHKQGSGFDYHVDVGKVEAARKNKGYFLIFTNDMSASPSDILYYYRAKDADEKLFAQIKVDIDGGRIRTHSDETTDGKTFVTFIACAIRSYLLSKLSRYLKENSTSIKKVFNQLSNISIVSSNDEFRFTQALTKKQKQILSALDAEEDIAQSVLHLSTLIL